MTIVRKITDVGFLCDGYEICILWLSERPTHGAVGPQLRLPRVGFPGSQPTAQVDWRFAKKKSLERSLLLLTRVLEDKSNTTRSP
jgi:hypothetical protein